MADGSQCYYMYMNEKLHRDNQQRFTRGYAGRWIDGGGSRMVPPYYNLIIWFLLWFSYLGASILIDISIYRGN
jgi:hypothetical protein